MTPNTGRLQILPALRQIQDTYGYLQREALIRFSEDSGIHLYRIQEVASFFPHFRLTPAPAVTVRVCRDMACHLAGSAFALHQLRPMAGERVCVEGVSCLSRCDRPPAVRIEINQAPDPGNRQGGGQHEFYCLGRDPADLTRIGARVPLP
jgi:NADH:ubiquinone oxidoreductase subunit E